MEGKNKQELTLKSKTIEIPIIEYEEDMETESAREKKKEILDLFQNYNNLRSEEELKEVENKLHRAVRIGDLELIKIYLSETIENDSKDLIFKIDRTNKTASLFKNKSKSEEIIIPRTVTHKSTEFLITSMCGIGAECKTVKFVEDSAVEMFYSYTFSESEIEQIYFPESLKELKEGWCCNTDKLTKIIVSPSNNQFIFKDNKYLLGKTNKDSDEFDILLFGNRNIKEISIPSNIKIISSFAFDECKNLSKVEIPTNSKLQTIGKSAFYSSKIKHIFIPPTVSKICQFAFYNCENLTKVEIPTNSKLQTIEKKAFSSSNIKEIFIPPTVSKICQSAFNYCENLLKVEIPTNSKLQTIEESAFSSTKIEQIYFPESLKELKEGWCCDANKLTKIIVSPSNNQFIFKDNKYLLGKTNKDSDEFDILLFGNRNIKEISIPSNIKIISSYAFENCENLSKVEIPANSKLQTIGESAFYSSNIKEIFIPPTVSKICQFAFIYCGNLTKIEIPANSKLQTIEESAFSSSNIKEIFIPPTVSKICQFAFNYCKNLLKVEIPTNSKLQIIEESAFSSTKIEQIYFPESLKELKEGWCCNTNKLTKIIVSPSNNQFIFKDNKYLLGKTNKDSDEFDILLFGNRNIKEISIPSNIKIISSYAFENCENLSKVEIPANSKLQTIGESAFYSSNIKQVFIPSKISKKIGYLFHDSIDLIKVEIPTSKRKIDTFIKKELFTVPHVVVLIDCSIILSLSLYNGKINIVTRDYKAIYGINDNEDYSFKERTITDYNKKQYFPISSFVCNNYDLYMVSEVDKGIKAKLYKSRCFLNIGNFIPVAIFGGCSHCAAIGIKGTILYIPSSYDIKSSKLIEPKNLPNNEEAVDIACLNDYLYVLSSKGKLYMSKNANSFNIVFKQVEQFKKFNIIQISGVFNHILVLSEEGKVYSKGRNLFGELGTGDKKDRLREFYEISSLNKYKITSVSAGENHSLFLTSNGQILACGKNESSQCFSDELLNDVSVVSPVETRFRSGAEFCISSSDSAAVCIGFDPEMSPNRRVKDEINILLIGCQKKTEILQIFINNNFENTLDDVNNQEEEEEEDYIVSLEVQRRMIKLRLIDVKSIYKSKEFYHRAMNIIYFFENLNQSASFDELKQVYEEANTVWNNEIQLVVVNCTNTNSKKIKYEGIKNKYKCELFEIGEDKNIENIDKPFYSFLPKIYKNKNEIYKIGKEYQNPFNKINKDHINIGLFGSKVVNKTELAFRYIYGDLYKEFYDDFILNFREDNLEKIVEINNKYYNVSILDSTFVKNEEDDFGSYYSAVQGIILVFQIELLSSSSSSDFINEINKFYEKARDSVEGELNIVIAFKLSSNNEINEVYQRLFDKINQIENRFESEVYLYSDGNEEDIEYLFYYLIKNIIQNKKQKVSKRKIHRKKKIKTKK